MGKKYIIELEDNESVYKTIISNGYPMIQIIVPAPYVKSNLEQVQKEAYDNGYETAKRECEDCPKQAYTDTLRMDVYQKGLSDAWEAARKIYLPIEYGGIPADVLRQMFDNKSASGIFKRVSASEAIEKIRQYEQRQEEQIQVGDEVIATSGKAVIVGINDDKDKARYIYPDSTLGFDNICNLSKTGRRFPEIAEVLQKMKEKM